MSCRRIGTFLPYARVHNDADAARHALHPDVQPRPPAAGGDQEPARADLRRLQADRLRQRLRRLDAAGRSLVRRPAARVRAPAEEPRHARQPELDPGAGRHRVLAGPAGRRPALSARAGAPARRARPPAARRHGACVLRRDRRGGQSSTPPHQLDVRHRPGQGRERAGVRHRVDEVVLPRVCFHRLDAHRGAAGRPHERRGLPRGRPRDVAAHGRRRLGVRLPRRDAGRVPHPRHEPLGRLRGAARARLRAGDRDRLAPESGQAPLPRLPGRPVRRPAQAAPAGRARKAARARRDGAEPQPAGPQARPDVPCARLGGARRPRRPARGAGLEDRRCQPARAAADRPAKELAP